LSIIDIVSYYDNKIDNDVFSLAMIQNIFNFYSKFEKLQKLTAKMTEVVEFGHCVYDPTRRMLSYKGKEITKLSAKEGGIIETLAMNFGQVVKRELILENSSGAFKNAFLRLFPSDPKNDSSPF